MPPNFAAPSPEVSREIAKEQPAIQRVAHLMNARQMDPAQRELSALVDRIQARLGDKTPPNLAFQVTMAVNAARGSELTANPQIAAGLYGPAGQGWLGPLVTGKAMQDMVDAMRLAQTDPSKAAAAMQRATAAYEPLKRMLTATEGTPEASQAGALFRPNLDVAVAMAAKTPSKPDVVAAGFVTVVDVRGDRLDLERRISAGLEALPANQNANLRAQWFAIDDKLAAIELQKANGVPLTPQDSASLTQLKTQQQALMRQLSGASQGARSQDVTPDAKDAASILQANLKPDEAIVSYTLYRSGGSQDAPTYSLCAFVLTATALQAVDLGPTAPIDAAVVSFLDAVGHDATPLARKTEVARSLYNLSFAPVAAKLGSAVHAVRIIPDGSLQLVPFDALHDGTSFLIDSMRFVYATSERELLPRYWPSAAAAGRPVVAGDLPYGPVAHIAYGKRFAPGDFPPIRGAAAEVKEVAAALPNADVETATVTDASFVSMHAPRILHIAAHGVFLPFAGAPDTATSRGVAVAHTGPSASAIAGVTAHSVDDAGDDPLARAALVLTPSSSTDGFLTALEVTTLDLWGTDLVVLSACDSGRGQVAVGEGVRGFRTAFESAGARTLVTSLWSVDDASTKQLMTDFYRRLDANAARGAALHDAMAAMRANKPDPYYWAPFVLLGEDGPLGAAPARPTAAMLAARFRQGLEFRRMQSGLSTSPGSGSWSFGGQSDDLVDADVRRNLGIGGGGVRIVLEGTHSELVMTMNGYRGPGSYPCQVTLVPVSDPLKSDPRTPPDTSSSRTSGNLVVTTDGGGHFAARLTLSAGQSSFDLVVP